MKKDGLISAIRSSNLKIIAEDDQNDLNKPQSNTSEQFTVADTRKTSNPRGVPKSGRVWKRLRQERFSTIKVNDPTRCSWTKRLAKKADRKALLENSKALKEERASKLKAERERIEAVRKRKLENERKAEITQVITDTRKIKRMKKKHLRSIEKR